MTFDTLPEWCYDLEKNRVLSCWPAFPVELQIPRQGRRGIQLRSGHSVRIAALQDLTHCAPPSFRSVANRSCAGHDDAGLDGVGCILTPYNRSNAQRLEHAIN